MNKIKVLYDVFKTMKDKEVFKGDIKLDAVKGGVKVFTFSNNFEADTKNGETKANISLDLDDEGKKVKHESNSEFNIKGHPHHRFQHGMGMHHGMHGQGGIKAGLSKVTFVLNLLNVIQVEEKEGKSIISLELKEVLKEMKDIHKDFHKDIPDEKRAEWHKKMQGKDAKDFHKQHEFIKEILCSENSDALLKIYANKNNEVEKIELSGSGENSINGSLDLVW